MCFLFINKMYKINFINEYSANLKNLGLWLEEELLTLDSDKYGMLN